MPPSLRPVLLLVLLLGFASRTEAAASPAVLAGVEPGTTISSPTSPEPPGDRSWPAAIGENFSTPLFADLNGDGVQEIIATDRSKTYVFDATGALLPGWPQAIGESNNNPAVADIDEDGNPEVIVAVCGAPPKIYCLRLNGTVLPGFPASLPYRYWLNVTAPAVGDIDGDGHLDVGAQSEPGVGFFDRFGQPLPGWPYLWTTQQNIAWSAPAIGDLDGDGKMEVVIGTNDLYNPCVHVIRHDGTAAPGWPQSTRVIFSSPALADLDNDSDLEIVVQEGDPTWYGGRMHVFHHDGTEHPGWPRQISDDWECSRSNPAIADVDGNGTLEIVTATGDAKLHILNLDGTEFAGYPRTLPGGAISSAQVVDVNGDGIEEIFLCYYAGVGQWVSGWRLDGTVLPGFPRNLYPSSQLDAHSSAHLADLEGDGDWDLCAQGGTFGAGRVSVFELTGSQVRPYTRADWPKIRHDTRNTGFYPRQDPASADGAMAGAFGLMRFVCSPNPASGTVHLSWNGSVPRGSGPFDSPGRLAVFDLAGRKLGSVETRAGKDLDLNLDALCAGDRPAGQLLLRWMPSSGAPTPAVRVTVLPR